MFKRILVPLDGSSTAEEAIPHAITFANISEAKLVLLRILEPFPPVRSMSPAELKKVKQRAREWAEDYFERISIDLQKQGISHEMEILEGRASVMIEKFAEESDIDLIVLASRGHTGLTRWLMGSVADRVIRGATVPVLLVPTKASNESSTIV